MVQNVRCAPHQVLSILLPFKVKANVSNHSRPSQCAHDQLTLLIM